MGAFPYSSVPSYQQQVLLWCLIKHVAQTARSIHSGDNLFSQPFGCFVSSLGKGPWVLGAHSPSYRGGPSRGVCPYQSCSNLCQPFPCCSNSDMQWWHTAMEAGGTLCTAPAPTSYTEHLVGFCSRIFILFLFYYSVFYFTSQ